MKTVRKMVLGFQRITRRLAHLMGILAILFLIVAVANGCGGGGATGGGAIPGGGSSSGGSSSGGGSATTGTISGAVTKAGFGSPIANATVTIDGASYQTNGSGQYSSAALPSGQSYTVACNATGYNGSSASGTVNANATTTVNFALTTPSPSTYTVSGTVTDSQSHGVIGAQISCGGVTATTDNNGAYSLANVPSGNQSFVSTHPNFITYDNGGSQLNVSGNLNKSFQMTVKSLVYTAGWSANLGFAPTNITEKDGIVYVCGNDTNVHTYTTATGAAGQFAATNQSNGCGFDSTGNLFVTFGGPDIVRMFNAAGTLTGGPWGGMPQDLRDCDGNILLDNMSGSGLRLSTITSDGTVSTLSSDNSTTYTPYSLAVIPSNLIAVACGNSKGIRMYSNTGAYQASYLNRSIASVGCKGNRLAINDPINQQVLVYYVGNGSFIQMSAINTGFTGGGGVDMDASFRIYVTDDILSTIRQYLP